MQKLVLIDGNAILHRAYHALPPMNSTDGKPTNAVYGFFSMLVKIIGDLRPEYLVVCFDRKKPTFRKQMFVGYQAKRPQMSDDLIPQVNLVHKALDAAKITHFGIDGYEADDLIGTISVQAVKANLEVIILSGDRDLLQLVNSHVLMLAPIVGISNMTLFDETKVKEKYGLKPSQFIDYKALVGDNSDNYPGVTGIGPKTAADLINRFDTLEGIYSNLGEINLQTAEKLAKDAEQAAMAKKLATIIIDAPLSFKKDEALISKIDIKGLIKNLEKLGFNNLLKRVSRMEIKKVSRVQTKQKQEQKEDEQMSLL
jgi:DNA polymerase-1